MKMESISSDSARARRFRPRSTMRPFRGWALCAGLVLAGCAAHQGQRPAPETPVGEAATAEATTIEGVVESQAPESVGETATADAEWFLDEETGQRYRVIELPKRPNLYRWLDEEQTRIRYLYGGFYEVVKHDERSFWVKEWAPAQVEPPPRKPEAELAAEAAAKRASIAASYESDVATVDRLELRRFDAGLPQTGQWRNGFDIADMNGDGHLDIVHGSPRKRLPPRPYIFLGDGRGGWRSWAAARFPDLAYDYGDVEVGDLNGDGHQDIALGFHMRGMAVLVGDGEGGFTPWSSGIGIEGQDQDGASIFSSRSLELVDWDRDGRLDILALAEGPVQASPTMPRGRGLVLYVNQGDGHWAPGLPADETLGFNFGDSFALGDFDGDGLADVAIASGVMSNMNILGLGTESGVLETRALDGLRPSALLAGLAIADHEGDGRDDLFLGYQTQDENGVMRTGVDVFSLGEDGDWRRRPLIATEGPGGVYAIDSGDLDGDGRLDVVAVTGNAEVWIFLGDGSFFARESSPELPPAHEGCRGYSLRLRDLDGDGRDEVIVGLAGEATGFTGIEELSAPGCPGGGSLRVWTPVPRAGAPAR